MRNKVFSIVLIGQPIHTIDHLTDQLRQSTNKLATIKILDFDPSISLIF